NRGHDSISRLARVHNGKISEAELAGGGAEIFTDCVDDIQGAINCAKRAGPKSIYLAGYSTGSQKSVYCGSKADGGRAVRAIILLGPISDYSSAEKGHSKRHVIAAMKFAKKLVKRGKRNDILPQSLWSPLISAQRFLSLYSGTSAEEIFTYW